MLRILMVAQPGPLALASVSACKPSLGGTVYFMPPLSPWGAKYIRTPMSCFTVEMLTLDEAIDVETLKLRELRYKMVDAGIYKSW